MQTKKYFLIVTLLLIALSACSPESKIIGTWYDEYGTEINFFKDGTFIVKSTLLNFTGDYRFVDKETLILDSEGVIGLFGSQIFTVEFSRDELYLDSGDSGLTLYNEVPDFFNQNFNDSEVNEYEREEDEGNLPSVTPQPESFPSVVWELEHNGNSATVNSYVEELFYSINHSWEFNFISEELAESKDYFIPLYPKSYQLDSGTIYFTNNNNNPAAYAFDDGSEIWVSDMVGNVVGSGENTIFVFTNNNRIYGLDKSTGEEKWKIIIDTLLSADEEADPYPYFIKLDESFIVPLDYTYQTYNYSIRFLSINENDGSAELTEYHQDIDGEPFMIHNDSLLVTNLISNDDSIFSIDIKDGSLNWVWGDNNSNEDLFDIGTVISFDQKNNILYFEYDYYDGTLEINSCTYGCLLALDLISGSSTWDKPISVIGPELGEPLEKQFDTHYIFNDYIYQVYFEEVHVFDKKSGNLINSYSNERYFRVLPGEENIIVYIPDLGVAKGIDVVADELLWEDDEFSYDKWICSFDNKLIYRGDGGNLVGLDITTGDEIWNIASDYGSITDYFTINDNLLIHKEWNDHLEIIDLNNGDITDVYTGGGWGRDSNEHIQVIDNNSWLYYGDYIALIKHE
ncbi:MAG: PQQ-binding-like beta-propeller repeat protein [Bacteroidales bacterium]|nr:PQQ-binding-like beta-propeller repeat protein [Bacteroidales bacterium]